LSRNNSGCAQVKYGCLNVVYTHFHVVHYIGY
jgi:hypothetical protein